MLKSLLTANAIVTLASTAHANFLPGDMPDAIQTTAPVEIAQGMVTGLDDGKMFGWLGLPYAAPPVGEARWMPPQSPEAWDGVRAANTLPSACAQGADLGFFATPGGSEDCLYLNVYGDRAAINRARAMGEKLPVLVWIHGGALYVGQGADYNPRALVADGKAIVVTINYRLGVFGFFAHPAIDGEGHPAVNYGQMDQTRALEWVQENIGAFGGDAENVTIAGESSGGNSVVAQVLSPWAEGLFQNAVTMSGSAMMLKPPHFGAVITQKAAQDLGRGFAEASGCTEDAAACLRKLAPSEIIAHQPGYQIPQTVIEGDFLPDWPDRLLAEGRFNRVNIISGTTRDEGDFFLALPEVETGMILSSENYQQTLEAQYGPELASNLAVQYPLSEYHNASNAMAATITDYLFACPATRFMDLAAEHTSVRAYEFADRTAPSYAPPVSFELGAAHTFELPFLFPGFHGGVAGHPTELNVYQEELGREFRNWMTSASESENWVDWPVYTAENSTVHQMQLEGTRLLPPGRYSEIHNCAFWDKQGVY